MPSSMTHSYFATDVYSKVNKNIKDKLQNSIEDIKVFSQGPDPYFFYNFHLTKKSKRIYEINRKMQHTKTNEYFISLINYINEKNYYYNKQVLSYLFGHICHFVLDSTLHPFIIYNTGMYNNSNKDTYKYNGLHEEMEYYIDIYLISKREKISPSKFKVYKSIFNINRFDEETLDVIDSVVKKVYGFNNSGNIYYKSIKDMKRFYYVFNYDKYGIKKKIYSLMDLIFKNKTVKKKELSFNVNPNSKLYYLNMENNTWNHPCDKNEKYNLSFFELYSIAVKKASKIINEVYKMLENKKIDNKKLENLFMNLNYGTGKNCDLNLEYKYFKF